MPFRVGNTDLSNGSSSSQTEASVRLAVADVRLRVIVWKSEYLTFSVTVLPPVSLLLQNRQTLETSGSSCSRAAQRPEDEVGAGGAQASAG
jgi:hypothetical protein